MFLSSGDRMRIAIIGTGIAGNVAAYELRKEHNITLLEAGRYVGGHTNPVDVQADGGRLEHCGTSLNGPTSSSRYRWRLSPCPVAAAAT